MTIEELIIELNKIENKKKNVCFMDNQFGAQLVRKITIDETYNDEPVLLKG